MGVSSKRSRGRRDTPGPVEFDFRGLTHSEPIVRLAEQVQKLDDREQRIVVYADDENFPVAIKSWCDTAEAWLVHVDEEAEGAGYRALIQLTGRGSREGDETEREEPAKTSQSLDISNLASVDSETDGGPEEAPESAVALIEEIDGAGQFEDSEVFDSSEEFDGSGEFDEFQGLEETKETPSEESAEGPATPPSPPPIEEASEGLEEKSSIQMELRSESERCADERLEALEALQLGEGTPCRIEVDSRPLLNRVTTWANCRNHEIVDIDTSADPMRVEIALTDDEGESPEEFEADAAELSEGEEAGRASVLVAHYDLEEFLAALVTVNAATACEMEVSVFFAFRGVELLRSDALVGEVETVGGALGDRIARVFMPWRWGEQEADGEEDSLVRRASSSENIASLRDQLNRAVAKEVPFTVCPTSMSVLGLTQEDLVDLPTMAFGGVDAYVRSAEKANLNMVF